MTASPDADPFDHLAKEHRALARCYQLFERMLDRAETANYGNREDFAAVLQYVLAFGDLKHHYKEETILVPLLVHQGFDWFEGPLARLRREHRQERYFLRVLTDMCQAPGEWSSYDVHRLVETGRDFVTFMTAHVARESEDVLNPAREKMPAEARARLLNEFMEFDARHATHVDEGLIAGRIDSLLRNYEV